MGGMYVRSPMGRLHRRSPVRSPMGKLHRRSPVRSPMGGMGVRSPMGGMGEENTKFYCLKCKTKRMAKHGSIKHVKLHNPKVKKGVNSLKAVCSSCGGKMSKIVK